MTPIERAREAATLKAAEVLEACFEFGGARPVREVVGEILAAYDANLASEGLVLVPKEMTDAMFTAVNNLMPSFDEVDAGMEEHGEDIFYEVIPGPSVIWSAMIAASQENGG